MTRVVSAIVLAPTVFGIVWFLDAVWTLVLAAAVLLLALREYAEISRRAGVPVLLVPTGAAALGTANAVVLDPGQMPAVLAAAVIAVAALQLVARRPVPVLPAVASALFAVLYLALPLGMLAGLRVETGREALLLLLACVVASDMAQYYGGRALGRHLLAPVISPNKTVEGAIGGIAAGSLVMVVVGQWWLSDVAPFGRAALGAAVALAGIGGDLFESSLKRAANMKDASALIPGHGGVLDRLDALLFAAPVYALVVQFTR